MIVEKDNLYKRIQDIPEAFEASAERVETDSS